MCTRDALNYVKHRIECCDQDKYSDDSLRTCTCKRPSRLRGIVTHPVGVAPFEVIAFSNS